MKKVWQFALATSAVALATAGTAVMAAEDLKLANHISFTADSGVFPIVGVKMDDFTIEPGKTHFIFFGAAGDLNTNRQANRVVELYNKQKMKGMKFLIVDVDNPTNAAAMELINKYYPGYVPAQVVLDRLGKPIWSQVGEVSRKKIRSHLDTQM